MCDDSAVAEKLAAGAPEEIEVTPAMIEAGVDMLFEHTLELIGPRAGELEIAIAMAYRAMTLARLEPHCGAPTPA